MQKTHNTISKSPPSLETSSQKPQNDTTVNPFTITPDTRIDLMKFELTQLYDWDRLHAQLRRRDLIFFFGVPSILLKIIGENIFDLKNYEICLSVLGFIISLLGFSISSRATQYVTAYKEVIALREADLGIQLSKDLEDRVGRKGKITAAERTKIIHSLIIGLWIFIFAINIYTNLY